MNPQNTQMTSLNKCEMVTPKRKMKNKGETSLCHLTLMFQKLEILTPKKLDF